MLEQEVRDMLRSKVRHAPALDEPPATLLRRARGRRIVNGAGVTLALALVAVGSLIGVRSLGTTPVEPITPLPGVIPWLETPEVPLEKRPACRAGDLALTALPVTKGKLSFVPRDDSVRCRLDIGIGLRIRDAAGRDVDVRLDPSKDSARSVLAFNGRLTTDVLTVFTDGCLPSGALRFDVTLPNNRGVLGGLSTDEPMACFGPGERLRGTLAFGPGTPRDAGSLTDLRAEIVGLPGSIARGEMLRYRVRLSNPSDRAIRFEFCPVFLQTMVTSNVNWSQANELNCAAAPDAIPAHRSVLFAMEFKIEPDLALGRAQFKWQWDEAITGRILDSATIRITE